MVDIHRAKNLVAAFAQTFRRALTPGGHIERLAVDLHAAANDTRR